jgi:hypothetical protein
VNSILQSHFLHEKKQSGNDPAGFLDTVPLCSKNGYVSPACHKCCAESLLLRALARKSTI